MFYRSFHLRRWWRVEVCLSCSPSGEKKGGATFGALLHHFVRSSFSRHRWLLRSPGESRNECFFIHGHSTCTEFSNSIVVKMGIQIHTHQDKRWWYMLSVRIFNIILFFFANSTLKREWLCVQKKPRTAEQWEYCWRVTQCYEWEMNEGRARCKWNIIYCEWIIFGA